MIDLTKVDYRVILLPPSGNKLDVTDLILSATHEEMKDEMAARLKLTFKDIKRDGAWVHNHVFLSKRLVLQATDGDGWKEIFRGSIYSWESVSENRTVNITAYDPLYATMQSEEHYYFTKGMTASSSIKQIASETGIPLGDISGPNVALAKKIYKGKIGETIAKRLEESKEKGAGNFITLSTKGKLEVVKEGSNKIVYELLKDTLESSSDKRTIESLVTKVKIYGNESKKTRPKVETTVTGKTEFGTLQKILFKSSFENMGDAKNAANDLLKENGKPVVTMPVVHPDIPWLRKGDKIKIAAGTVSAKNKKGEQITIDCIVESVSRDLKSRKMTLKIKKV
ncbi:hypothetical protein [Rummeliibacillus sp. POC4]|uniref:XkdQ/YqbQ family protein n=1 Tax=Rummeliibacillus sp. POC4 TaxID=2305899 RepID=UPI000E671FDC|nr:hypothetical protein [Rummeliibacillus sp. POC4]RIJ63600.1 hypothetical protein D1606_14060 [Rummeliibacillus sp. POC4]